jgi:hypothetical protein
VTPGGFVSLLALTALGLGLLAVLLAGGLDLWLEGVLP